MPLKSVAKSAVLSFFRLIRPGLSGGSILMYHSIGDNGAHFTVAAAELERQLAYLAKKRKVVPLSTLCRKFREGEFIKGHVALTFDDGYQDNLTLALPILEKYNLPATIFVITGMLNEGFTNKSGSILPLLTKEQLIELGKHPLIEVMPHSVNHPKLTKIPLTDAIMEMEKSKEYLETIIGMPARIFAYPKGRFNAEIAEYVRTHDWDAAVSTNEGIVHQRDDRAALKRNAVDRTTTLAQFKAKVSDAIELYARLRRL